MTNTLIFERVNLPGDCVKKRYYPFCRVVAVAAVERIITLYVFDGFNEGAGKMSGLAFWGPFALTVLSNVLYHNIAKWTPVSLNPMLGLGVTYFVSFVLCVLGYYFTGGGIRNDIQDLNWVSVAWGVVLVGIEVGYLLLYRAGWEISIAPLMVNVTGALILIALGVGLYNESLTMKQGIGIIFCLLGFFLVRV